MENENGAKDGGCCSGNGAEMRAHLEAREQAEKHENGQRGNESGEPPTAQGVVDLSPGQKKPPKAAMLRYLTALNCVIYMANGKEQES